MAETEGAELPAWKAGYEQAVRDCVEGIHNAAGSPAGMNAGNLLDDVAELIENKFGPNGRDHSPPFRFSAEQIDVVCKRLADEATFCKKRRDETEAGEEHDHHARLYSLHCANLFLFRAMWAAAHGLN